MPAEEQMHFSVYTRPDAIARVPVEFTHNFSVMPGNAVKLAQTA
jgi:hypothetical protein